MVGLNRYNEYRFVNKVKVLIISGFFHGWLDLSIILPIPAYCRCWSAGVTLDLYRSLQYPTWGSSISSAGALAIAHSSKSKTGN